MASLAEQPTHRSYLFAPGSNERVLGKALRAGADAVVCDLEDAVAVHEKGLARDTAGALVRDAAASAGCAVHVRVNPDGDGFSEADVRAVVHPGLEALRLPKCESASAVAAVDDLLRGLERERGIPEGSTRLYPTIESAAGALAVGEIARASARTAAVVFGPADFSADIGLVGGDQYEATLLTRSMLVLHSRAAGISPPVDGAFPDLADTDGLLRLATRVRGLGFGGKSAIHPAQLPVLHEVFTPTEDEVERARRVVASLEQGNAVAVVDGGFVDAAVVAQARRVLDLAGRISTRRSPR